nr:activating transcription factor 7-interacting protein 1 [Aedes albopictus]XP_029734654.1 activating transcription factor 7-interacting protein 1 [Aedes albopictus]XP_029734655.1 activating transcription factor 7-interacting protein 1 [Aedes albopictus]XP_029734656.1 activating transcription factor 7-interacting protein 1 [Aedes albopictus]XP_029734657.1 activating transcription factor 7-interacting protein 1 [Aedes albopictus]XP_029734658.1 activating transcription factor 7-interacting prot
MMEVDQPITENGLSKMSPNNVDSVKSAEIDGTESAQPNGTVHTDELVVAKAKSVVSAASAEDDSSNEAKGLEDEDTMERLMYTELDDGDDEVLQPESSEKPADELVQNLSDTLIEDIIQLNKDSKRTESETEADPDRLEQNEESSDIPPSSSGQSSNHTAAQEADGEDTNGATSAMEDETSIGVDEEDFTADDGSDTKGEADIDEESESILLQEEDNQDLEDELEVDERLLLDEDVDMEDGGSMQGTAIQIDDSAAACMIEASTVEITDGSVTIDESGLSILNTAAVDIEDMTVDESTEVSTEPKSSILVSSDVGESAATEESVELPTTETAEVGESDVMAPPPVNLQDDIDPPSPDISDLIKFPDVSKPESTTEKAEETDAIPEVSDLIKFPDDSRTPTPELSDLIKFDSVPAVVEEEQQESADKVEKETDDSALEEKTLVEEPSAETSEQAEVEIPPVEDVEKDERDESPTEEKKEIEKEEEKVVATEKKVEETEVDSSEKSERVIPEPLENEKTEREEESSKDEEKKETSDVTTEKLEDGEKKEEEKEEEGTEAESNEDDVKQKKDVCPQALQAADEEDLLEMMEEPDRMDADDDHPEEDLDDNSSESGSTKQNDEDGEEDDDYEGSDYMGADEDESSRNVEDQDEAGGDDIQGEEEEGDEGEPPLKRKCSVDVREVHEESEVDKKEDADKDDKKEKEAVDETTEKAVAEKVTEKESPKPAEDKETTAESDSKVESEEKKSTEVEEKKVEDEVSSQTEVAEKDTSKPDIDESKKEDVVCSEKEDEKMDVSQEEPVVVEKTTEELTAKAEDSSETEKKLDTEGKTLEKEEVQVSEKSEATSEEKDVAKTTEAVVKESTPEEKTEVSVAEAKDPVKEVEKEVEEKEPKSAEEKTNDEVLVIDDDDDDVSEANKEDKTGKKAEKRPCPEDDTEEKVEADTAKKIRLSVEEKEKKEETKADEEQKEEPKAEVEDDKKEEKKSKLDTIEPLKVTLDPEPVPPKEKKSIRMEFLEKFKKPLEKMNRSNLEDFVLQKIVEGIAFKSAIAEMRTQLDAQDTLLQGYRQKVHDLNKQFRDLEMVHERVVKDLEKKNQHFITPVKITRAVGLQVSQPRFMAGNRPAGSTGSSVVNSPKNTVNRSPVATPPGGSPNKNAQQNTQQIRRPRVNSVPSTAATQKSPAQQSAITRPGAPTILNKSIASPQNSLLNKSGNLQGQVTPLSQSPQVQSTMAMTQTPPNAGTTPPLTRKKPLQKFTPMRPPLSITQQVQQQQQTRQMQEQLMRQQIQEVQTSNSGGQSPLAQSPQGSPLTRTPEPASSPVGLPVVNRPPQMVMKKVITPQAKPTPTGMQALGRPTPSMVPSNSASNVMRPATTTAPAAVDNSLIDLTDEDDVPKPAPTVVAAPVVPKPPITILNGQQHHQQQQQQQAQYGQRQAGMPPLVVINQQRMMTRPTLQQRPAGMMNGAPQRPVLMQRPANATNGFPRQSTYRARMINGQIGAPRGMIVRAPIRQPPAVTFTHPAPLPQPGTQLLNPSWKQTPPRPSIRINNIETGIVISWTMDDLSDAHATIISYQIYAYQETNAPPSMDMWRHVGDVKAMLLPMAVTLTQFQEGQRYHFAVRAVDEHQRVGQFSPPRTWNESTPAKA